MLAALVAIVLVAALVAVAVLVVAVVADRVVAALEVVAELVVAELVVAHAVSGSRWRWSCGGDLAARLALLSLRHRTTLQVGQVSRHLERHASGNANRPIVAM